MIGRRQALRLACSAAAIAAVPRYARALGRTPLGGRVTLRIPWSVSTIDPHDAFDPAAALFATAIADAMFALDTFGNPYPALAQALPVREGGETLVRVREGLRTARGVPLDGRDLVASIERARAHGAGALLADLKRPVVKPGELSVVSFGNVDPASLARVLASPLVALLPRRFSPQTPDATGAFRADLSGSSLTLSRNILAARGPSFLDAIEVFRADDLKGSLRAFEAERDDIGWLGMGLHDGRKGALRFDFGRVAFVVLTTGEGAGSFGLPGVAQRLVSAFPPERLAHLGLGPLPAAQGDPGWGGPPAELIVDETSPHLLEIARAVSAILTRPGHEVTLTPVPRAEVRRRKGRGKPVITVEVVRPAGSSPAQILASLAGAEDLARAMDIARHPPKVLPGTHPRLMTSTLRVGVVGEIRIAGGVINDIALARQPSSDGWDLGATFRRSAKRA